MISSDRSAYHNQFFNSYSQEYLGSYVADEAGRLVFREGALVTALRRGHWVVLDELNLAPTEVLEALNRCGVSVCDRVCIAQTVEMCIYLQASLRTSFMSHTSCADVEAHPSYRLV